ncbi:MAG: amidohydrolase family protein [Microbacterium sp.]
MYKIFSVDDHIVEPADLWVNRLPAKYQGVAPRVVEEDGREFWVYEEQRGLTMGLNAVAGLPRDEWNMEPMRFTDMIPGCYEPKDRARDLLSQGVLASVNFPTLPRFGGLLFNSFKDKDLASLCVQAWNDFILDEWCPAGPEGMFVPMVICQVWDTELAVKEIERCVDKGAKSLCFMENPVPEGLPSFHHENHWDPIWAVCQEAGIPISMHIGSSGYMPIIDPSAPFTNIITIGEVAAMLAMTNILVSDVCVKFPDIKLVFSEGGVGWVPAMLHRADRQLNRHSGWAGERPLKPSEIFEKNMWVCMVEEPMGLEIAYPRIGAHKIVSELDYPHADTTYPRVQESFAEVFAGIPDDVVAQVSHGNAEALFNWKMADEALLLSPDVQSWRASLDEDPHAAMKTRHDVEGVTHATGANTCKAEVREGAFLFRCDKPLGADGRCPDGHVAV